MHKRRVETVVTGYDGQNIYLRNARPEDMRRIQVLYAEAYGANYPMTIISDKLKMRRAIESDKYYWFVAECQGRIVASLIYEVDPVQKISKAFGAVVSKEFRKHDLANTMMEIILKEITSVRPLVDTVYATTRTITVAPQRLIENLGFIKLGIFPNAHKVFEHETHCLAGYFVPAALKKRKTPAVLIHEMAPLYRLVRRQLNIGKPVFKKPSPEVKKRENQSIKPSLLHFETISAPSFIRHRFARAKNSGVFKNSYVPFHEPNLILITPDLSTEVFLSYSAKDSYSIIMGGATLEKDYTLVLNSVAKALDDMKVSYIELLVDAYSPDLQWQALNARFLPSAYFPAYRKVGSKRWDYVVFSRSFEMLDFRNVKITSTYRSFLREYLKLWETFYIDLAFKDSK